MKASLLVLCLILIKVGSVPAFAFDCDGERRAYDDYRRQHREVKEEYERTITLRREQEQMLPRVETESAETLARLAEEYARKDEEVTQSIVKRQLLMEEHKQVMKELRSGQFCSKCNRSRSQIEKEERISFAVHLRDVKASSRSAPVEVLRKTHEEYVRKWKKSLDETIALEKERDRLEEQEDRERKNVELKKQAIRVELDRLAVEHNRNIYKLNEVRASMSSVEKNLKRYCGG